MPGKQSVSERGHIPTRMCMGCRKRREKRELIRLTKNAEGVFVPDEKKISPGRGFYLCPDPECFARAQKKQPKGIPRIDFKHMLGGFSAGMGRKSVQEEDECQRVKFLTLLAKSE
jgi:hypothetical protein